MAMSANNQALTAAFIFGLVLNAASGAAFLFVKAHGRSILRDGPRLVLAVFLVSSCIWAQVSFAAFLIDTTAVTSCQVAIAISSGFDQLARVALEQFLLASIQRRQKRSIPWIIVQIVIFLRFILACAFVGVQRPQFKPVCTTTTLMLPLGVSAIGADFFLAIILFVGAISAGLRKDMKDDDIESSRAKGLLLTIAGLLIWTASSVPFLLGIDSIDLIPRTVIPATGLLFAIGIVAVFQQSLVGWGQELSRGGTSSSNRGPSQGALPGGPPGRNISTSGSYFPPNRYEELKSEAMGPATANLSVSRASTMPMTKPPALGQSFAGMAGLPVQGQLYPTNSASEKNKERLRNLMSKNGKMSISNPILDESSSQNPLKRMPTIDLATAARNEKERRIMAPPLMVTDLVPSRPAPVPGASNVISRKEIQAASSGRLPRKPSGELIPELPSQRLTAGSSSSAQLSPGTEELRRRSPRQSPVQAKPNSPSTTSSASQMGQRKTAVPPPIVVAESAAPPKLPPFPPPRSPKRPTPAFKFPDIAANAMPDVPKLQPKPQSPVEVLVPTIEALSISPPRESESRDSMTQRQIEARKTFIRSGSVKTNVRPSRQRPPSPPDSVGSSARTLVETKPTFGLPSNPRARSKTLLQEQTVMLFNEIVYTDPAAVKSINEEANAFAQNQAASAQNLAPLVVDRPRPRTRQPSMDRTIFPVESSPRNLQTHYRSLSAGSAKSKLSILNATAGDPSQLPPLPPLPLSAGEPLRPQPNKTKSMTFNEKMDMFYSNSNAEPDVPPLPVMRPPPTNRNVSKFSVDSSIMPTGPRGTWLTQMSQNTRQEDSKRQSSPVLPLDNLASASLWSEGDGRDGPAMAWGSIHSPAQAINIQKAKEIAVAPGPQLAAVKMDLTGAGMDVTEPAQQEDEESEVVMVLLDPSMDHSTELAEQASNDETVLNSLGWHRRVGDDCPTFSRRDYETNSRRFPPPTPLALNRPTQPVFIEAEPSPLESPEQALQAIELQLKKLEDNDDDDAASVEAKNRMTLLADLEMEMGQQENHWLRIKQDMNRDSLSTVASASVSSPSRRSRTELVRISIMSQLEDTLPSEQARQQFSMLQSQAPSQTSWRSKSSSSRSSIGKPSSVDRQGRNSNRMSSYLTLMQIQAQLGSPTPPETDESESESEYVEESPVKATAAPLLPAAALWESRQSNALGETGEELLWAPLIKAKNAPAAFMPAPGLTSRATTKKSLEPLRIESTQLWAAPISRRASFTPMTGLWKTSKPQKVEEVKGAKAEDRKIKEISAPKAPPRPLTLKPPRRTKRITMLPDILESPKPLPNKRDTLGIFQFPWGEKSDVPILQYRPQTFMAIPGTMSSGVRPPMNILPSQATVDTSRVLSPQGYSSSFLDEYEQEDDLDSLSEYGEEESSGDDDFDESTLWEIASLLQTNNLPSRASLFPSTEDEFDDVTPVTDSAEFEAFTTVDAGNLTAEASSTADEPSLEANRSSFSVSIKHDSTVLGEEAYYDEYDEEDEMNAASERSSTVHIRDIPTPALTETSESQDGSDEESVVEAVYEPEIAQEEPAVEIRAVTAALWSPKSKPTQRILGLPQSETGEWYPESATEVKAIVRAKPRKAQPATIESAGLWLSSPKQAKATSSEFMWSSPKETHTAKETRPASSPMWSLRVMPAQQIFGLPQPETEEWYPGHSMISKDIIRTKSRKAQPAIIQSTSLWSFLPRNMDLISSTLLWSNEKPVPEQTPVVSATTWSPEPVSARQCLGLPQSETKWTPLLATLNKDIVRAKLRKAQPAGISSNKLWKSSPEAEATSSELLWSNMRQPVATAESVQAGSFSAASDVTEAPEAEQEDSQGFAGLNEIVQTPTQPAAIPVEIIAPMEPVITVEEPSSPKQTRKNGFAMSSLGSWWSSKKAAPAPVQTQTEKPIESPKSGWLFSPSKRGDSPKSPAAVPMTPPAAREGSVKDVGGIAGQDSGKIMPWRGATPEEWKNALQAAIRAGRPRRAVASEAEWAAALEDAIAAGTPAPVEVSDSLVTTVAEIQTQDEGFKITLTESAPTQTYSKEASLWTSPSPALPSPSGALWQPTPVQDESTDTLHDLSACQYFKAPRPSRSEKVRSLYSTSFEFSSQALWNPTRAITQQQQRDQGQKDWLREESAFGWY